MSFEEINFHFSPAYRLKNKYGDEALVSLYGAQVLSWIPRKTQKESLFLSPLAQFEAGKAIRGGIPVCFPQFGSLGNLPAHGFARNRFWKFHKIEETSEHITLSLILSDDVETRALWPYTFEAVISVTLELGTLKTQLSVRNADQKPFSFTCALHTYFNIDDVNSVQISGLEECSFIDQVDQGKKKEASWNKLKINTEIDRIYENGSKPIVLQTEAYKLVIASEGFTDSVLWNPWIDKSCNLKDFPDDGYRSMVCIESGVITLPIKIQPKEQWVAVQILSIE